MIKHIVCFKLRDNSPAACEEAKSMLLSMEGKVPQLRGLSVGVDFLHSERSYDLILEVLLEDEAALEELAEFIREMRIERAGVFTFSPEEGTRAALMEHVDLEEAQRRTELLVDVQSDIIDDYNDSILGTEREVLCEGFDPQAQMFFGRSYAESPDIDGRIYFTADREVEAGTFVIVRFTGVMDGEITGELVEE